MNRLRILSTVLLVLTLPLSGCMKRTFEVIKGPSLATDLATVEEDLNLLPPFPAARPRSGSLWADGGMGSALVRDHRAFQANDLITIVVQETSSGTKEASTDLSRSAKSKHGAPFLFGLTNFDEVLTTDSASSHSGDGSTALSSRLTSTVTARVMRVLPNGAMLVAGHKTVMVNRAKDTLTLVGLVRPVDVTRDNRVSSAVISDLTVRLWGKGELNDTVRQGWFNRIMNRIWPF